MNKSIRYFSEITLAEFEINHQTLLVTHYKQIEFKLKKRMAELLT